MVVGGLKTDYGVLDKTVSEKLAVLKQLVAMYYGIQKVRVAMGNRVTSIVKEYGQTEYTQKLVEVYDVSEEIEKTVLKHIKPILKEFPIYTKWLKYVKGVGDVLAAGLIAGIKTPARFSNISKLWKYCGMHVVDGEAPTRRKGAKVDWNPFMKTLCWKLGESFVKTKGYYRQAYERFRAEEERKSEEGIIRPIDKCIGYIPKDEKIIEIVGDSPLTKAKVDKLKKKGYTELKVGMTKAHIYARAKRKTVKLFLAHLWHKWRELEGLPVTKPYAHALLGHSDFIEPPEPVNGKI